MTRAAVNIGNGLILGISFNPNPDLGPLFNRSTILAVCHSGTTPILTVFAWLASLYLGAYGMVSEVSSGPCPIGLRIDHIWILLVLK